MLNATWKYGRAEKKCILNASTSGLVLDDDDVNICLGLFGMHSPQSHIVCCCISCSCTQNARKIEFFRNASSMPVAAAEPSQMPFKYGSLHNCTQYRLRVLCSTQSTHTENEEEEWDHWNGNIRSGSPVTRRFRHIWMEWEYATMTQISNPNITNTHTTLEKCSLRSLDYQVFFLLLTATCKHYCSSRTYRKGNCILAICKNHSHTHIPEYHLHYFNFLRSGLLSIPTKYR